VRISSSLFLGIRRGLLGRDLIDATLMEQQDGSDDSFRYALSGGPAHIMGIEKNSKTIRHEHVDAGVILPGSAV
jgi:hypothetical protein